jgi:penicillin amidase
VKKVARAISRLVLRKGWPRTRGRSGGHPLDADVVVARDRWGIPHITAGSLHDGLYAQGFAHAQDRLWQMETLRRLCDGRLSEVAGEAAVAVDWFSRMAGLPEMKRRTTDGMSDEERALCQAYADGVNACVRAMGRRLPLEFSSLKHVPEPWSAADCVSALPYISFTQTFWPWAAKLLAISQAGRLTEQEWNDMFPVAPGAVLPHEPWFDRSPGLRFGAIRPEALSFHANLRASRFDLPAVPAGTLGSGSNNWVVARGKGGRPLLANDPHLGASLPSVWYFCHLRIPGVLNAAGTSIPGAPGVVLGRSERTAWGVTNFMLDAVDILTCRVDPENPLRYVTPSGWRTMEERPVTLRLPRGRTTTVPLFMTEKGPVVTTLEHGVTAAAVMRWYGTAPEAGAVDHTFRGVFGFMRARSAEEVLDSARDWKYASMNFVAADVDGHIGWQVSGAAPVRAGYSGRLPGDASAGQDWTGFLPPDALPRAQDPAHGFFSTANWIPEGFPRSLGLSYYWCVPYRHQRIQSALRRMDRPGVEEFQLLQMDVHSLQADRILPALEGLPWDEPRAGEAARMLASWDREVRSSSAGAAVFEVFLVELTRCLLEKKLDGDLDLYMNTLSYGVENEILERPASTLWNGERRKLLGGALAAAMTFCEQRMGADRRRWSWGRIHQHAFHHRGATSWITEWLLDPARAPAHGDCSTVNVSWSTPSLGSFDVTTIPSMRLIADLGNPDGLYVAGPLGQSGQPGHRHYNDMTRMWREGSQVRVPLSEAGVREVTRESLVLGRA